MKTNSLYFLFVFMISVSCNKDNASGPDEMDFKNEMRNFVIGISQYSKALHPGFFVIPQNGQELVTSDGNAGSSIATGYMNSIDGQGREDLFYGYGNDDAPTDLDIRNYITGFLDRLKQEGKTVLVTDYCFTQSKMIESYAQNSSKGYVSFAADHRKLDDIPAFPSPIYNADTNNINQLSDARNFLYLINPEGFDKAGFINAVKNTDYDLVIMDLFLDDTPFNTSEIESMKHKKNGGTRLLICYMSIGEAEDYRYYWQAGWSNNKPSWLGNENPAWPGNYQVKYWEKDWQNIIYGNDQSYIKRILDAHFDGVYLDLIDAFENWE